MAKIVTHSGNVHFDDFLSSCLILSKDETVDKIERKFEVPEEEMTNKSIWKVDVGKKHDPTLKAFDHHQEDMDECSFSLLLKDWGKWDAAKKVFNWLDTARTMDEYGLSSVLRQKDVKYEDYFSFNSYLNVAFKERFGRKNVVNKDSELFSVMKWIGNDFFARMDEYNRLTKRFTSHIDVSVRNAFGEVETLEEGVPVIIYLGPLSRYPILLNKVFREYLKKYFGDYYGEWIKGYRYDRPKDSIRLKRHGKPSRVNLYRLAGSEKTYFADKTGNIATLEEMPIPELKKYVEHAIDGDL